MTIKHVVLRRTDVEHTGNVLRGLTRASGIGAGTTSAGRAAAMTLEFEELSPRNVAAVAREKGVEAVAPVVPLKLIAPVKYPAKARASGNGDAWGIKAVGAETSPFTGKGAIVAVLDTGIDAAHPAFAGVNLIRKNFTTESDEDLNGHGTHCAGTIAGRAIRGKRIGVAPGIETLVIGKVLGKDGGSSDVLLAGIEWALQNGAHVISMSLGIDFPGLVEQLRQSGFPTEIATSIALEGYRTNILLFERLASLVEARAAFAQPCLLVGAAGNESQRDRNPDFEVAVSPPAVADGIVSVAAVGQSAKGFVIAPFSNTGARMCGPGVGVLSAKPGGGLVSMSGTSMATPHIAGVAALWVEKLKKSNQLTARVLMDRLVGSGTLDGMKSGFDPADVGAGMVSAPQTA